MKAYTTIFGVLLTISATGYAAKSVKCSTGKDCFEKGRKAYAKNDSMKAIAYFKKGCEKKDETSCQFLEIASGITAMTEPDKAGSQSESECANGDYQSCVMAGDVSIRRKDGDKAMEFYRKACDGGLSAGCERVKTMTHAPGF